MTEKELLDLLGDVRPDYIVQTEAFRRGGVRPRRKRHTGRRVLSIAAMLAAVAITVEVLICGIYVAVTSRDGWKISLALMSLAWLPVAMMEKYPFCDNTLGGLFLLGAGYLLTWALEERKNRKASRT